jgi:amidohydrolase
MIAKDMIINKVQEANEYVMNTRGYLHTIPELSGKEYETSKFLLEEIKKLGLPFEMVTETGFIATLDTGKPGKTVALRTDLDALPMDEDSNNLKGEKKFVSKIKGACHSCGHDAHMAMMLGAMKVLCSLKDQLTGKVLFCFEDGEEIWTGIYKMMDVLATKQVDAVYGTHVTSFMKSGTISVEPGPRMAGAATIEIDVLGKSGHGSRPDLAINPLFAAAQVLTGISSAWNNQLDVTKTVTLGLAQIHGGTINNIIPEKVFIGGTLRFFDMEAGAKAVEVVKNVATLTAKAHGCEVNLDRTKISSHPVINDDDLAELAIDGISQVLPENSLVTGVKWFASESFSLYGQKYPSVLAFVGIGNEELGSGAEHHNIHFDVDDNALKTGVAATVKFATDFLNN